MKALFKSNYDVTLNICNNLPNYVGPVHHNFLRQKSLFGEFEL